MNLQTALLSFLLLLISAISISCTAESQRDSVRKSDLVGSKWILTKLTHNDENILLGVAEEISIEFRTDLIGGDSGCNNYQVGWTLGRDGRFNLSGPIALTRKGCLDKTLATAGSFIEVLTEAHTIVLADETLVIDSMTGQLIFTENK